MVNALIVPLIFIFDTPRSFRIRVGRNMHSSLSSRPELGRGMRRDGDKDEGEQEVVFTYSKRPFPPVIGSKIGHQINSGFRRLRFLFFFLLYNIIDNPLTLPILDKTAILIQTHKLFNFDNRPPTLCSPHMLFFFHCLYRQPGGVLACSRRVRVLSS